MPNKDIKDHASLGGKKRAESLTAKQRSLSASNAAKARWASYNEKKNHVCNYSCICSVCDKIKIKGAHTKYSGEGNHDFKCRSR